MIDLYPNNGNIWPFFSIRTKIAKRKLKKTRVYQNIITIVFIYIPIEKN